MTAFGVAIVMVIAGKLSPLGTFDMRAIRRLDVPSSNPQEFVVSNSRLLPLDAGVAMGERDLISLLRDSHRRCLHCL